MTRRFTLQLVGKAECSHQHTCHICGVWFPCWENCDMHALELCPRCTLLARESSVAVTASTMSAEVQVGEPGVQAGVPLTVNAQGEVIPADSSDKVVGTAVDDADAGQVVKVVFNESVYMDINR